MKILKFYSIILILLFELLTTHNAYAACEPLWSAFVQQPNEDNFSILKECITTNDRESNLDIIPAQIDRTSLNKHISKGNQLAFRAGILVFNCLDGGELEDFYRSAGLFFEIHPRIFFDVLIENKIPDSQYRYMLTMLPLYTVDNIDLKISILEKRIGILNELIDPLFVEMKKKGIFFLDKERVNLLEKRNLDKTINPH